MEAVHILYDFITNLLNNAGAWAPFFACFLIIIESMIPVLPLFVFITINFMAFGHLFGFIISWICTIIGCVISYLLCYKLSQKRTNNIIKKHPKVGKLLNKIKKLKLSQIAVILAVPFTPAFAVNIAAGITHIPAKKYIWSLAIGKVFLVYFWGYIGVSLIESLKQPTIIIKVLIMMLLAFVISKIINSVLKIDN